MPLKTDEPTMAEVYGDLQEVKALVADRMAELEFLRAQIANIREHAEPLRAWLAGSKSMPPTGIARRLLCAIDFIPDKTTDEPAPL